MSDSSILRTRAPYHILGYGTLLGTQVYQSFVGGIVSYRALPRAQFATLQQSIFPVYFALTSALPVLLAFTYPGTRPVLSTSPISAGWSGVLAETNRRSALIPLVTMFATSLANMLFVGPETTRIMRERKHQETRDGKKSFDSPPHSNEMIKLNRAFARMHGASSLLNLVGLLATVWYGLSLAERLQ